MKDAFPTCLPNLVSETNQSCNLRSHNLSWIYWGGQIFIKVYCIINLDGLWHDIRRRVTQRLSSLPRCKGVFRYLSFQFLRKRKAISEWLIVFTLSLPHRGFSISDSWSLHWLRRFLVWVATQCQEWTGGLQSTPWLRYCSSNDYLLIVEFDSRIASILDNQLCYQTLWVYSLMFSSVESLPGGSNSVGFISCDLDRR